MLHQQIKLDLEAMVMMLNFKRIWLNFLLLMTQIKSNQNLIIKQIIQYHQILNFRRILLNFLLLMILLSQLDKIIILDKVIPGQIIMHIHNNHIHNIKDNNQEVKMINNFNKT